MFALCAAYVLVAGAGPGTLGAQETWLACTHFLLFPGTWLVPGLGIYELTRNPVMPLDGLITLLTWVVMSTSTQML